MYKVNGGATQEPTGPIVAHRASTAWRSMAVCGPLAILLTIAARATTFTPNTLSESPQGDTLCSLREAILQATANLPLFAECGAAGEELVTDLIVLADGANYSLVSPGMDDTGLAGDLDIDNDMADLDLRIEVAGEGRATITQNAMPDDRVLHLLIGSRVEIDGVTVTGGFVLGEPQSDIGGEALGGGILNEGTLSMRRCAVVANGVQGGPSISSTHPLVGFRGGSGLGAGIFNRGTLSLMDCAVLSNDAVAGAGGPGFTFPGPGGYSAGAGVYSATASVLSIMRTTIATNRAMAGAGGSSEGGLAGGIGGLAEGAGLWSGGDATIADSAISLNTASGGAGGIEHSHGGVGGAAFGGGIRATSGSLAVTGSTVARNTARGGTGGPAFDPSGVKGGNGGQGQGGGLHANASITLSNDTVSGNSAAGGAGGSGPSPGSDGAALGGGYFQTGLAVASFESVTLTGSSPNGIYVQGSLTLRNSIVALQASGPDCFSLVAPPSADFNLESGTTCGFTQANDQQNVTAAQLDLGPLASNGGPTETHSIGSASFALDVGDTALVVDQRGIGRPQGPADDIGAFERVAESANLVLTKTGSPDPVAAGGDVTYTLTLTNLGPGTAWLVSLSDAVPAATTFVSFSAPPGWAPTTPPPGGTGSVLATLLALPPGLPAVFTLVVQVNPDVAPGTTITNTALAASDSMDVDGADNSDTATTLVAAASVVAIPALSHWGLAILLAALGAVGCSMLRRW